jgi:hypothetical protein
MSKESPVFDEDRIITSADIDEPFYYGNHVEPLSPAVLLENAQDHKELEEIRRKALEKARKERVAKWEQSEQMKAKLEAARQKRKLKYEEIERESRLNREETVREAQGLVTPKSKAREVKCGGDKGTETDVQTPGKCTSNTPGPRSKNSNTLPKTPLKARLIKELAGSYSPTF